jgi:hypothetical protein
VGTGFPIRSCSEKEAEHDLEKWEPVFREGHARKKRQSLIRKSGNRFSCSEEEPEHDPEKWKLAFQKDYAQNTLERDDYST